MVGIHVGGFEILHKIGNVVRQPDDVLLILPILILDDDLQLVVFAVGGDAASALDLQNGVIGDAVDDGDAAAAVEVVRLLGQIVAGTLRLRTAGSSEQKGAAG